MYRLIAFIAMKSIIFKTGVAVAIAMSLTSCFKDESLVITGITLNGCVENMTVGTDYTLSVKIDTGVDKASQYHWFKKPDKVDVKTDVRWESEDNNVATVDQNGKVTPQNPGTTTINVILDENNVILEQCYVVVSFP